MRAQSILFFLVLFLLADWATARPPKGREKEFALGQEIVRSRSSSFVEDLRAMDEKTLVELFKGTTGMDEAGVKELKSDLRQLEELRKPGKEAEYKKLSEKVNERLALPTFEALQKKSMLINESNQLVNAKTFSEEKPGEKNERIAQAEKRRDGVIAFLESKSLPKTVNEKLGELSRISASSEVKAALKELKESIDAKEASPSFMLKLKETFEEVQNAILGKLGPGKRGEKLTAEEQRRIAVLLRHWSKGTPEDAIEGLAKLDHFINIESGPIRRRVLANMEEASGLFADNVRELVEKKFNKKFKESEVEAKLRELNDTDRQKILGEATEKLDTMLDEKWGKTPQKRKARRDIFCYCGQPEMRFANFCKTGSVAGRPRGESEIDSIVHGAGDGSKRPTSDDRRM